MYVCIEETLYKKFCTLYKEGIVAIIDFFPFVSGTITNLFD